GRLEEGAAEVRRVRREGHDTARREPRRAGAARGQQGLVRFAGRDESAHRYDDRRCHRGRTAARAADLRRRPADGARVGHPRQRQPVIEDQDRAGGLPADSERDDRSRTQHRHLTRPQTKELAMDRGKSVVTPERFASGMTFDQYVAYVATPENLKREGSGRPRADMSGQLRAAYAAARLHDAQAAAIKWLAAQPGGPAKVLVISEEWSSDCRRDVPMLARLAEAGGLELRIFRRDGQHFSKSHHPTLAEAPDSNADIMAEFLNTKNGQT